MYIQIQDGQPVPITLKQLRETTKASFREDYPASQLAMFDVFKVETDPQPAIDHKTQRFTLSEPTLVDGTWRRTWTVTDIPLADLRAGAALTRLDFLNKLAAEGVLTDADAIQGAKGDWPTAMATFLDYLTPAQARDAQIEWATADTIRRMHPFVLSLGSWLEMTDEQVDSLFGVGG